MFVRLIGAFEMRDDSGRDCTPRGAKTRALIAMLCQTPDRRRPRRWLEGKLWSDRGAEQASGSLRQSLMELRKSLGEASATLLTDRDSVQLAEMSTDLDGDAAAAIAAMRLGREFLEGIDIVDPAFLDWLREERRRIAVALLPSGTAAPALAGTAADRPPFVVQYGALPDGVGNFAARELALGIARLAAEFSHLDLYGVDGTAVPAQIPAGGLVLHLEGAEIQGRVHMMASLVARSNRQTVWSQRLAVSEPDEVALGLGEVPPLVFQAAEATLLQMPRLAEEPLCTAALAVNARIARAMTDIFSYDGARLRAADLLLAEAQEILPSARLCAWRSLVRQIMFVERTEDDPRRLQSEADAFARNALEHTAGNPLVLALVSHARVMVDENPEAGTVLARDAVRLSPFNAFGYWSEAAANIRHERLPEALASARRGAAIASRSSIGHWWEALSGLAALRGGLIAPAIAHYEAAHYRAPSFRAAMRHLAYLYLEAEAPAKARRVLTALVRAEPDFHPARLLTEDYPATTLRRSGLAERHLDAMTVLLCQAASGSG
ncbi:hypothetical protein LHP98_06705 [Rhodobacter sp. Har01]|uniref:hypothetical protein n=1 Tax=Rhodobacter sp. Har01 TaxID=2883999 RepID=UPI001D089790|nr:hypothetical protein [Rhodobacter sp. Har01]MCB6177820.1 hypothetical protein [Rhodobacter sp. Har01]